MLNVTDERTCSTCGYRRGSFELGKCELGGTYPQLVRKYHPNVCNLNFSGWVPRPGILYRFFRIFRGSHG